MPEIYRKKALDQLASPDQLDELLVVTDSKGWLALLGLGALVLLALVWGIFGSVPTRIAGRGILLHRAGVLPVVAASDGQALEVPAREGDRVEAGATVAVLSQPALREKIDQLTDTLQRLRAARQDTTQEGATVLRSFEAEFASKRASLAETTRNQQAKLALLKQRLSRQEELHRDQLITDRELAAAREEVLGVEGLIRSTQDEQKDLLAQAADRQAQAHQRDQHSDQEILDLEEQLRVLQQELRDQSAIISPNAGRILSLEIKPGDFVRAGERIAVVEPDGKQARGLEALVYVRATAGKRIHPGMEVHVQPSTVKAEEYGVMLGKVASVSSFPLSRRSLAATLENDDLAQAFSTEGPPIEIRVELIPSPETPSGFRWSSPRGPPIAIGSGTECAATITVERRAPISLVAPVLRRAIYGAEEP